MQVPPIAYFEKSMPPKDLNDLPYIGSRSFLHSHEELIPFEGAFNPETHLALLPLPPYNRRFDNDRGDRVMYRIEQWDFMASSL